MIIEKNLLTLQPFVVDLCEIGSGVKSFSAITDKQFFESFGNPEILDANVNVEYTIHNKGVSVDVTCRMVGSVTVPCDLCLEPLEIGVETGFSESYTPEGGELDLSQDVYDFVIISLPLRRAHEEGECNEETTKFLSK